MTLPSAVIDPVPDRPHHPAAYDASGWPDSHWAATAQDGPDCPPLHGDRRADVAVLGAGYAGLSAALHLAQAGRSVAVLDAAAPGWGASGRNGGFCCLGGAKLSAAAIRRRMGDSAAADFAAFQRAAVDRVAALLEGHGIEAEAGPRGELLLAHRPRADAALRAEAEAGSGAGLEYWSPAALAERGLCANGMHGALFTPHGFPLHPLKYARGLARAAQAAGAALHGQSPVTRLSRGDGLWRLTTPDGVLSSPQLLVATNGYSSDSLPPWLSGRFLPVFTAILVTRPLTEAEREAQGWTSQVMASDSRDLLHYFRLLPCGRFLFGMRGGLSAAPRGQAAIRQALRRHFAALFPAWSDVPEERLWSGLACLTGSLAPFVGPVPRYEGLHAAFGWHGNGVAAATEGGLRAAEVIAGQDDRIPALLRRPPARLPLITLRFPLLRAAYAAMAVTDGPLPRTGAARGGRAA